MDLDKLLKTHFVDALAKRVIGDEMQVLERPAAFILKKPDAQEDIRDIHRLLVLPPKGYTSNKINQTNCFAGVEKASVQVKGAVRDSKNGFSKVKDCLLCISFNEKGLVSDLDRPYVEYDIADPNPAFEKTLLSAGEPPRNVVKVDGTGFYHTLVNLSDDWLVLQNHKVIRPSKEVNLDDVLLGYPESASDTLKEMRDGIIEHGDKLFDLNPELIREVQDLSPRLSLPALGEMLYIRDTGEHETCTAFGMILKVAQDAPVETLNYLYNATEKGLIPEFFGNQLIEKIERRGTERQAEPLLLA